jgi:hypothetical protein
MGGDVVIINEPPGSYAPAFARRGAQSRGKERTTIEIVSEPLLMDLDELALGAGPADAVRDRLSKDTKAITGDAQSGGSTAAPSTLARRKAAADNPAAPANRKRYSGGRTGFKAPNQTVRLFNDSGRLADGWFVRENKEDRAWTVNAPANRLDPTTFGPGFDAMLERFRALMPVLKDSRALLSDSGFSAAVSKALSDLVTKGELAKDAASVARLRALAAARKRAALAALKALRDVFAP